MEWREVGDYLEGSILKKDIKNDSNVLLLSKDVYLTEDIIHQLEKHSISKVYVSLASLEKELLFQLEALIQKSKQPLFWESYISLIEEIKVYFTLLSKQKYENPERLIEKLLETLNYLEDEKEFIMFSYSIQGHVDSLYKHSANVAILAYIVGKSKTLPENPIELAKMGVLHDIGKSTLDKSILYKESSLTYDEKKYIQSHTYRGVDILKRLNIKNQDLLNGALLHHELRNGNGYPFGYSKNKIPINVQIITVLDIFDTICSERDYKKKQSVFEGINEIFFTTVNGALNPLIAFPIIEHMIKYFVGEEVILNDGTICTIYHFNQKELIRPIVKLDGNSFIDLSKQKNLRIIDLHTKK